MVRKESTRSSASTAAAACTRQHVTQPQSCLSSSMCFLVAAAILPFSSAWTTDTLPRPQERLMASRRTFRPFSENHWTALSSQLNNEQDNNQHEDQQPHHSRSYEEEEFLDIPDFDWKGQYYQNDEEDDNDDDDDIMAHLKKNNHKNKNYTSLVEKKIRVAKAQSEIDRILAAPDAPFDADSEMKKVISMSTPPPFAASEHSDDDDDDHVASMEEELLLRQEETYYGNLEAELYAAVQEENYSLANYKRQSLQKLHMDDSLAVLQANANFYRAFSRKDYDGMQKLWLQDDTCTCIHPSNRPLIGAKAVGKSWKSMFAKTKRNANFQRHWMEPTNIRLSVKGAATAIVTCDEMVYSRRFVRGQRRQTELVNQLVATNIFRKVAGRWYMVYHHASWHADSEMAKQALLASSRGGVRNTNNRFRNSNDSNDVNEPSIGMDGILGRKNMRPLLGGDDDDDDDGVPKPPPIPGKRIVMGSLSDILNGNLDDLLSKGSSGSASSSSGGSLNDDGNAIIRFHRIDRTNSDSNSEEEYELVDGDDDDDDDVYDEDEILEEDEIEIVGSDDENTETVSVIKDWAPETSQKSSKQQKPSHSESSSSSSLVRKECISLLRTLCEQGSISPKQKRVLLTDIITCSAKGEKSMVEVAYGLLVGCSDDEESSDIAEEEFADQCRVLAESLPGSHVTQTII